MPNQPEIPAFVASVFIQREMRDAMKKGEENQVVSEGISRGEIMPNVDVPALFGWLDCHENIYYQKRERKERKERTEQRGQQLLPELACMFPDN